MNLRNRVALATVGTLAVGLTIVGVALNVLLANRLMADADTVLRNRAGALVSTLDNSGSRLRVRDNGGDAVLDEQAWVFDAHGRLVEHPLIDEEYDDAATSLAHVRQRSTRAIGDRARLLAAPAVVDGERVGTVVVGVSLAPYERTEHLAALGTLVLCVFVVAAGALLARRAVGAALRPVADMTAQAADWSEHDLDRRFALGAPRDELTGLAATLDGLLERISAALRHEQRFSAEMAHELRTPLSGVRAEAELALTHARSDAELRAALEQVLAGTDRMAAVIDTLLVAAKREGAGPLGSSDAAAIVRSLADNNVRVVAPDSSVPVGADRELVAAALHPLLENAVRHARREVRIELLRDGREVVVSVSNDGEEIPVGDAEHIFDPGWSATGGAGLGLALARRLARAAGGEVVAAAPAPRFELRLPAG